VLKKNSKQNIKSQSCLSSTKDCREQTTTIWWFYA